MPILDMPVREMEKYMGSTPRPADFDAYWDKALAEMKATDPEVQIVPANFSAPGLEFSDLYFTGVRNARIHVKYVRPAGITAPAPAVLRFHGYSGNAGSWMDSISYAAAGFSVFSMDCRGQGGSSEDSGGYKGTTFDGTIVRGLDNEDPQDLYFRHVFLDTAELAKIAMSFETVDETRVYTIGGSQGGGLSLACAALAPTVSKCVADVPFLCDYRRVWAMDLDVGAYRDIRYYFRNYDPKHEREEEIFTKLGYIDNLNLADRIKADVVMNTGLLDNVCPPSTQYAVYNRLQCRKKHVVYPDFAHEGLPGAGDAAYEFFVCDRF